MEGKYNILITYNGDGDFKFIVKRIGEIIISKAKPVYIYNVDATVINDLRTLKRLLLDIHIGAKPTGAFKVYDFDAYSNMPKAVAGMRPNLKNTEPISNNEITAILKGGSQAPVEEPKEEEPKKDEEPKSEDKKPAAKKATAKKKSTSKKTSKKK